MLRAVLAILLGGSCCLAPAYGANTNKKAQKQEALFKKLDTNNDGKLSIEEFSKIADIVPKLKNKAQAVSKRFTKLDANGDGLLSLEEFKSANPKKKGS